MASPALDDFMAKSQIAKRFEVELLELIKKMRDVTTLFEGDTWDTLLEREHLPDWPTTVEAVAARERYRTAAAEAAEARLRVPANEKKALGWEN